MILVTGASGFLGNHVARALIARGETVRLLTRPTSNLKWLEDVRYERAVGDLRDRASLEKAVQGCSMLFHVAADYRFDVGDPQDTYKTNVEGTRHLLEAAGAAGVKRIVYTSTVGCIGLIGRGRGGLGNEDTPVSLEMMHGTYKRTKFQAEQVALELSKKLPIVIVNPTTPVGEYDFKPTPTGEMIVRFLRGQMYGYIETGLNLIDARDCAEGHVLAAEKGRIGQRYILGCRNMSLLQIGQALSKLSGLPEPQKRIPFWLAYTAAWFNTKACTLIGKPPSISLEGMGLAKNFMWVDCGKAVRELNLPQTAPEEALARAVEFYRRNGYVPGWPAPVSNANATTGQG